MHLFLISFQNNSSDHYKHVNPCSVQLLDIIDYNDTEQDCIISKYGSLIKRRYQKCMTSKMLITYRYFTSNLTKINLTRVTPEATMI